jgi:hypothetical protein
MAAVQNTRALTASIDGSDAGAIFNVNTATKRLELPNGAGISFYSDAYTTGAGQIANGTFAGAMSASSPDPGANGTINTAGVGIALVTPAAARSGIILQPGIMNGQEIWIVNQGAAANTLTFHTTPATSNVANAASASAIVGQTARKLVWIGGATNLWFPTV